RGLLALLSGRLDSHVRAEPHSKEHAHGNDEELRHFADAEPENRERDPRDAGNRAQDLDDRFQEQPDRQYSTGEEPDDDAEDASHHEAGQRAAAAPVDIAKEQSFRQQLPRGFGDMARWRDQPIADESGARR